MATLLKRPYCRSICNSIRERWRVYRVAIVHRVGRVDISEASVCIAVSSEHRAEALDAVRFAIDELKRTVAIWKKEVYADKDGCNMQLEESCWKQNAEFNANELTLRPKVASVSMTPPATTGIQQAR